MRKSLNWLKSLSFGKKVLLGLGAFSLVAVASSAQTPTNVKPILSANSSASYNSAHAPKTTTKTIAQTEAIPFSSSTIQAPNLAEGSSKITTVGVDGSKTLTYKVTYTDGVQTAKTLVSTNVDVAPINQVTSIGTFVASSCPNGTYVNSDGNTVCSPYSSPSAPAGATAQCNDDTYSFSQHRSGTCSHRGGVATWL